MDPADRVARAAPADRVVPAGLVFRAAPPGRVALGGTSQPGDLRVSPGLSVCILGGKTAEIPPSVPTQSRQRTLTRIPTSILGG
jgi:hypothetical protein